MKGTVLKEDLNKTLSLTQVTSKHYCQFMTNQ